MIKKYLLGALVASSTLFGQCSFESQDMKFGWTAFKMYEKIGVGGTFDNLGFESVAGKNLHNALLGTSLKIATSSVNSNDKGRDATLVKSFFEVQNVSEIKAKIVKVAKESLSVEIEMNGVKRTIPFKYSVAQGSLQADGVIDLNDFHMLLSVSAINKACYDLHDGKTWQDVLLSFNLKLDQGCH